MSDGFLTVQAFDAKEGKCVGTVVCKMGEHRGAFRGYIAMLVVLKPYRGRGIGDTLLHYLPGSKIVVTFSVVNKELSCILWMCKVALHCKLDRFTLVLLMWDCSGFVRKCVVE